MGSAESRLSFQEKLDRLGDCVLYEDEEYWTSLFNTPLSVGDVFELIAPEDVRKLRTEKKLNTSNLFKRIVHCLKHYINEVSQGSAPQQLSKEATTSILTCVRLLTRIMPFMLEEPLDEFVRTLFWTPGGYVPPVQQEFRQQNHSEIREVVDGSSGGSSAAAPARVDKERDTMTIGVELLACLQRLLFLKGFGCSASGVSIGQDEALPKHKLDTRFVWKGGIGTSKELPTSHTSQMLKNRVEILRCILVCLSGSLYLTIDEYQHVAPIWLRVFTRGEFPYTANVFSSLMSTIFTHDPVGLGVPYGGVFSSGTDESQMIHVSLQLLAVLFDFNPPLFSSRPTHSSRHISSTGGRGGGDSPAASNSLEGAHLLGHSDSIADDGRKESESRSRVPRDGNAARNVYRSMLSSIKKDSEIDFMFEGFVRLLQTAPQSRSTYLPGSQQSITYSQELLLVLWHLLTSNQTFLRRVTSRLNCNRLLVPILFLLLDASNGRAMLESSGNKTSETGPSRVGVLHMCSFLLLVMSSERDFAVRLNDPFAEKFPLDIPIFQGSYADLLVLVIHRVVVDSTASPANDSLIDMLLTVMCNISAYTKSFCLESCVKLLSLLQRFTRPSWLFTAPYHYHDVFFLLDMFNNIIQYQYEGNQRLVYSILRQKDFFTELQNLEFPHKYLAKRQALEASLSQSAGSDTVAAASTTFSATDSSASTTTATVHNGSSTSAVDSPLHHVDGSEDSSRSSLPSEAASRASDDAAQRGSSAGAGRAAAGSDVARWIPTEEWFLDWKAKLPLQTIARLLQCLLPMVESECQEKGLIDQSEVLNFLQHTTLVGLLPVPHPIIIRNYQPNAYTSLWFTSYMWGLLFSQSQSLVLYDWRKVRLIVINNRSAALSSGGGSAAQQRGSKTTTTPRKDMKENDENSSAMMTTAATAADSTAPNVISQ